MISAANPPRRVLVVEDHPFVGKATQLFLAQLDPSLDITLCTSAQAALKAFEQGKPWFRIFLDIDVPGAVGLSLIQNFAQLGVADICAVITGSENRNWRLEVTRLGMLGYIQKSCSHELFIDALELVLAGQAAFPLNDQEETPSVILTRRQKEILQYLGRGMTSKQVASVLGIADRTVDNHIYGLLDALGVETRAAAVRKGIELGIIDVNTNGAA